MDGKTGVFSIIVESDKVGSGILGAKGPTICRGTLLKICKETGEYFYRMSVPRHARVTYGITRSVWWYFPQWTDIKTKFGWNFGWGNIARTGKRRPYFVKVESGKRCCVWAIHYLASKGMNAFFPHFYHENIAGEGIKTSFAQYVDYW